jgi:hypothetical protein
MKRNWYGGIGSISTGTLRSEDLLESFLWEAKHLRLTKDERKTVSLISKMDYQGEFDTPIEEDVEELRTILDNHSLPYFYFGAHPGDGADFGWWLSETITEDFDGLKVNDTSEVPRGYTGEVLHVNDHGNLTLYSASRGRLHEVWAVV